MKLLIFGQTGQVATELCRLAGPGLSVQSLGRTRADLNDPDACAAVLAECQADAVINAAAYTAVDKAEDEEELATRINGHAPGAMARVAAVRELPFLHISTDYVFDGSGTRAWAEDDAPAPLGAYGRSKLAGERAVAQAGGKYAILRTSWVFAGHGRNFVQTMLQAGAARDRLSVVDDQTGGPTAAADIAATLVTMARALVAGRGAPGIFHYCGMPAVSWCGFARQIFAQANWMQPPEIVPIRTVDWPTPAARPVNSRLDCARIRTTYGVSQPDWRISLRPVLAEIRAGELKQEMETRAT